MTVAGIVLAAGLGHRMGRPKAEIEIGGVRLLDRATDALRAAGCEPVIAVVQQDVRSNAITVVNPDPASGMRSSLEAGIEAVTTADAVAVILVDMPGITGDAIAEVIAGWRPGRITVGTSGGRRTHPTVMSPRQWREAVVLAESDEGARRYLAQHPGLVDEVPVAVDPTDLDTPEDLARW